jgi:hypothetical protein
MSRVAKYISLIVFVATIFSPRPAQATSYDVSASVPYPVPTVPATIDSSLLGQTVQTQLFQITGTCEFMSPATIISVFRAGASIGSTSCSLAGRYQLDVSLIVGANVLTIRSSNISNQYGPDSAPGTISLSLPVDTPAQIVEEQKARSDLNIITLSPFIALTDQNKTALATVIVTGGNAPYVIEINWGDGSIETRKVESVGNYTFTHEYARAGTYRAVATVTDVLGVQFVHYFAVVSVGPLSEQQQADSAVIDEVCGADSVSGESGQCGKNKSLFSYLKLPLGFLAVFLSGIAVGAFYVHKQRDYPVIVKKKNDKKK